MNERCRDEGNRAVVQQAYTQAATGHVDDLGVEAGIGTGLVLQEAGVQPVADVALRHAVQAAALRQLHRHVILRFFRRLLVDDRLQQTMVDHIAVFTDRRCPGGVSLQTQTEVWPRRSADLGEGLEATDAAVEELGRLRIQVAAQFAETVEGQQLLGFGFHAVGLQHGDRLFNQRRIETGVHVVHAEAQAIAQHDGGADVGGDHALFNDAVGAAALLGNDLQHVAFFTQHEAVVRTIFEHQRMLVAPGIARIANALQQGDLLRDGVARRLPAGNAVQPVGDFVVHQFGFGFDLGGEELNIVA